MITAQMIKELRTLTGASMMDCKKALFESDGNMKKAETMLKDSGDDPMEPEAEPAE